VLEAAFWGGVGGAALLIGAALGLLLRPSGQVTGLVMALGAGVLVSAVAFELTAEAFAVGGTTATVVGLATGALAFYAGDTILDRRGGQDRKRSGGQQQGNAAMGLVLGALLDGIPESAAIGVSLLEGSTVGVAVVAAVFLSNIPESMSAATGLRRSGRSALWILGLWAAVAVVSALAAAIGFASLGSASPVVVGTIQAFAAGAILTMLADTMMPEAFEEGGRSVGLLTCLGFTAAFLLSQLG
jgi:ZIP family zinc transporter